MPWTMQASLAAVFVPLTVVATALRLLAKSCNTARLPGTMPLAADDYFAILASATFSGFVGSAVYSNNVFADIDPAKPQASVATISQFFKSYWVASLLAPLPITCAKLSILCLYHRLFSIDKTFRIAIYLTGFLCLAWWMAATVSLICTCIPISSAWKPALPGFPPRPGHCFDYKWFYIGIEIPNCILDFWIVLMPMYEIRKLQLSSRIKTSISFMFLLAGFVGIFSFVRMILVSYNSTSNGPASTIWIALQLGFAVICCNLPTYRPLLPYLSKLVPQSITERASSSQISAGSGRTKNSSRNRGTIDNIQGRERNVDDTVPQYDGGRSSDGLGLTLLSTMAVGGSDSVGVGGKRKEHWRANAIEATTTIEIV